MKIMSKNIMPIDINFLHKDSDFARPSKKQLTSSCKEKRNVFGEVFLKYLFIWLCWVLVASCEIFHCHTVLVASWHWDLSFPHYRADS